LIFIFWNFFSIFGTFWDCSSKHWNQEKTLSSSVSLIYMSLCIKQLTDRVYHLQYFTNIGDISLDVLTVLKLFKIIRPYWSLNSRLFLSLNFLHPFSNLSVLWIYHFQYTNNVECLSIFISRVSYIYLMKPLINQMSKFLAF
jgi:hypothetical protein